MHIDKAASVFKFKCQSIKIKSSTPQAFMTNLKGPIIHVASDYALGCTGLKVGFRDRNQCCQ